jgi:hypothetical protein
MTTDLAELDIALRVLARKFVELNDGYLGTGHILDTIGGVRLLDAMASVACTTMLLVPEMRHALEPFVRRVDEMRAAEEQGVRSTRFDRVEESMDAARRDALAAFVDRLSEDERRARAEAEAANQAAHVD